MFTAKETIPSSVRNLADGRIVCGYQNIIVDQITKDTADKMMVLFSFKGIDPNAQTIQATDAEASAIEAAFLQLAKRIPGIHDVKEETRG